MKKILFIFAFLTLLFISSCNKTSIKIINMENKNGEYYLKIDKDVDFISLSDYVSTTDDYEIETKQHDIKIDDDSVYLVNGYNNLIITQGAYEFYLTFYKEYEVTVEFIDDNNNELYSFEVLVNSKINIEDVNSKINIPSGFEWDGLVLFENELVNISDIIVEKSIKLTPIYKQLIYDITISNDLGLIDNYKIFLEVGKKIVFDAPNIPGYNFLGLYANNTLINDDDLYNPDMGTSFIVKYEPISFTITYVYNNEEKVENILFGEIIELFIPTVDGYSFINWNLNGEVFENEIYNYTNDIVLTGVFEPLSYQIIYQFNGEEKIVDIRYNSEIEEFIPAVKGNTFLKWELSGVEFSDKIFTYLSDITLNAVFKPNVYQITYQGIEKSFSENVVYGDNFKLYVPEKAGFEFIGWFIEEKQFFEGLYEYDYNITLTAKWERSKVSLNLETFGGVVNNNANISSDGIIELPIPEKAGFEFVGWYFDIYYQNKVDNLSIDEYNNEILYAKYNYNSDYYLDSFVISKYNEHISTYDVLTMFDSNQSGFASKYWHKIGVSLVNDEYYVSGIAGNGTSINTLNNYDFIILAYGSYNLYDQFEGTDVSVGSKVIFSTDPILLEENDICVLVSFVKCDVSEYYEEISDYLAACYCGYNEIDQNITLIDNYNYFAIDWKSSHNEVISSTGILRKPASDIKVTLSAYIGDVKVYEFDVLVKGGGKSNALATGYIYTPYDITQNAMNTLDIIYCAFLDFDANADFTNLSRMTSNINNYIKPLALKFGTKIVVSINQGPSGAFSAVAASPTLREKLATNVLKFIQDLEIDGVDVDWEVPGSNEIENFTLLMKAIFEKVKAANPSYLVTAAIGGGKWQPPKYDLTNSTKYMDYVNLMTYSMATGNGYYQNALYKSTKKATLVSCSIDESVKIFNDYGVENSKILVGIPFYLTVQSNSGGPGSLTGSGKSIWYSQLETTYAVSDTMKEYFDEECGVPYRYDSVNKIFVSYENEKSIKRKCEYINSMGLAGIMYWQYGQDVNDLLSNAIAKYINGE